MSPSWIQKISSILDNAFIGISGILIKGKKTKALKLESTAKDIIKLDPPKFKPRMSGYKMEVKLDNSKRGNIALNIVSILNARIIGQVANNMGTGSDTDVLNFQTGRFAESVQVTSAVSTRANQITVFYTYMKNPYGTFDPGGRQYKTGREGPQQIIGESIRELATQLVSSRFTITPRLQ